MAQAVSFGLIFATVLTLVVVPVMYMAQERAKAFVQDRARALVRALRLGRRQAADGSGQDCLQR